MVVTGQLDPAKLMAVLQQIDPSAWGDLMQNLPGWIQQQLPGLLQQAPIDLGAILGALGGGTQQQQLVASPQTAPTTGYRVVDQPGEAQGESATDAWKRAAASYDAAARNWMLLGVILVGAFFYDAYRRKKGTLK